MDILGFFVCFLQNLKFYLNFLNYHKSFAHNVTKSLNQTHINMFIKPCGATIQFIFTLSWTYQKVSFSWQDRDYISFHIIILCSVVSMNICPFLISRTKDWWRLTVRGLWFSNRLQIIGILSYCTLRGIQLFPRNVRTDDSSGTMLEEKCLT